jgi:XTP/dITP diphosphohydrolase
MTVTTLVAATNNKGKLREIMQLLPEGVELKTLGDIGFAQEIPEPYETFEENAATKARTVHTFCGLNVFAEDSGICVPALDGAPGVHSARYAGEPKDDGRNLAKLADEMWGKEDRRAYYKAVICLIWEGEEHYFEGTCHGRLAEEPRGSGGFGYDPIFMPDGYNETFGELPDEVKNNLSHRGEAVRKMVAFIKTQS